MGLLNYTSNVPADKTIAEIQRCLVDHGARAIMHDYDNAGSITALTFKINLQGQDYGVKLPTDWRPVLKILESGKRPRRSPAAQKQRQEQALRTAWRITKDWVEAQMAIVEVKMASMEQVFLPYIMASKDRTVFDAWKQQQGLLEAPKN